MKRLRHPIRAIREPFGAAGLIVAMIALVAALGGTALAASKLNSTQKKEVEKIAKKYAGKPGAAGTNGTNGSPGAKGDPGAPGAAGTGTPGANGTGVTTAPASVAECASGGVKITSASGNTKVCNGTTGFTETLPKGKTETGTFVAIEARSEEQLATISFAIPLAETAAEETTPVYIHNTETPPTGCSGSAAEPEAEEGFLCVFEGPAFYQHHSAVISPTFFKPGVFENGAGNTGSRLLFSSEEADSTLTGTWAVTSK